MDQSTPRGEHHETSTIATLQSLIVAFVLAMTFRGFVTEGFVIPTGSMAPTLMGEHLLLHSDQTGITYPVDAKGTNRATDVVRNDRGQPVGHEIRPSDPMLGRDFRVPLRSDLAPKSRMGDRILVLKSLYPFAEPDRFDVVVFKNPTDPDGEAENYIKRLIGLPGEAIWLVDGDVFVAPGGEAGEESAYEIQRKPEYVQRAVWQSVHDSDYVPLHPDDANRLIATRPGTEYQGPPWTGESWETTGRRYRCETAEPTVLTWDRQRLRLTDWTPYNMFSLSGTGRSRNQQNVSDLRVCADLVADEPGLSVTLDLEAREHLFRFEIAGGETRLSLCPAERPDRPIAEQRAPVDPPRPGRVYAVEFWHADQAMLVFVDGDRVGELRYDWTPRPRIESAYGVPYDTWKLRTPRLQPLEPKLRWRFEGSPVTLHRVRVDRDLYYRPDTLTPQAVKNPTPPGYEELVRPNTAAYGTHPDKPAVLGPDHFFMLGDNSPASSDSRLWGNPHPYVAEQIDDRPFLVHRKLLLGKAWVVYFPAPYPLHENGRSFIPNFGRLRFIR